MPGWAAWAVGVEIRRPSQKVSAACWTLCMILHDIDHGPGASAQICHAIVGRALLRRIFNAYGSCRPPQWFGVWNFEIWGLRVHNWRFEVGDLRFEVFKACEAWDLRVDMWGSVSCTLCFAVFKLIGHLSCTLVLQFWGLMLEGLLPPSPPLFLPLLLPSQQDFGGFWRILEDFEGFWRIFSFFEGQSSKNLQNPPKSSKILQNPPKSMKMIHEE